MKTRSEELNTAIFCGQDLTTSLDNFILGANLKLKDIKCCGISTQRATFINWRRSNGEPFHNFITWKDLRADKLVNDWNASFTMKVCAVFHILVFAIFVTK